MISRIEAYRYRCFAHLKIDIAPYNVLAGANGSGKSTLMDISPLLGDMLTRGTVAALLESAAPLQSPRAQELQELVHCRQGNFFSFAIEAILPENIVIQLVEHVPANVKKDVHRWPQTLRYEVSFQIFNEVELQVQEEYLWLFPNSGIPPPNGWGIGGERPATWQSVIARSYGAELGRVTASAKAEYQRSVLRLALEPQALALANVPRDVQQFPALTWFTQLLQRNTLYYSPYLPALRKASPPGLTQSLKADASNLPWLALYMHRDRPDQFAAWVAHVQTALPYLMKIEAKERKEDHHAYLLIKYRGGYDVTSSGLSDGTLRILAYTILPYLFKPLAPTDLERQKPSITLPSLASPPGILCVEEPEDGIHPRAIETVLDSLRSMYNSQVWLTTHSPTVLAQTDLAATIIMRRNDDGSVDAMRGPDHPRLSDWKDTVDLGTLFAAGVLE